MTRAARVVWITGLSGAGKSTIARRVQAVLFEAGTSAIVLDGDAVRAAVGDPMCGHDPASRLANAYRVSRLATLVAEQGVPVVVATMSLFHEIHEWNAAHMPGYFEVFLRVPIAVLRSRDPKGLYRLLETHQTQHVGGIDFEVEEPRRPDLIIDNSIDLEDPTPIAECIVRAAFRNRLPGAGSR